MKMDDRVAEDFFKSKMHIKCIRKKFAKQNQQNVKKWFFATLEINRPAPIQID